jgi:hypothetical protein
MSAAPFLVGVLRFAEPSAAFRMTIVDIFDLKKLGFCLV